MTALYRVSAVGREHRYRETEGAALALARTWVRHYGIRTARVHQSNGAGGWEHRHTLTPS